MATAEGARKNEIIEDEFLLKQQQEDVSMNEPAVEGPPVRQVRESTLTMASVLRVMHERNPLNKR